jgi:hypothetical protein
LDSQFSVVVFRVQLCTPNGPEESNSTKHGIQIHTSFISFQTVRIFESGFIFFARAIALIPPLDLDQ